MNRTQALALVQSIGLNGLMAQVGRTTDDAASGYGPALDRAFSAHAILLGVPGPLTTVDARYDYGFQVLLRAVTYDLVIPALTLLVDTSVDAPLTSAKFSQTYRALAAERDRAWEEAAQYGYGTPTGAGGFRVNMDFLEPGNPRNEYA